MNQNKRKIALFFDAANHNNSLKGAGVKMKYSKLLKLFDEDYWVHAARYYSGISEDEEFSGVKKFLAGLSKSGFEVVTKPVRKFPDGSVKANIDVELTVDMLTMAPKLDQVVLFSGDGDFIYLVDTVQKMGVFVTVCSHKPYCSMDLREQANEFLELTNLIKQHDKVL